MRKPRFCIIGGSIFAVLLMIGLAVAIFYAVRRPACTSLTTEPPGSYFRPDGLSTFEILCHDDIHHVKWMQHGDTIGSNGNPYTVSFFGNLSSKLIFKNGTKDLNGIYTCDSGSAKKSIQVEFQSNTIYFNETEERVTAKEGSRLQFSCSANSDAKVEYKWLNDNWEITNTKNEYVKNYEYVSFLNIDNVESSQTFRCVATNIYGTVSKDFHLTALKEKKFPSFCKSDEYVEAVKGSNLQLHCLAQSDEPVKYMWVIKGLIIQNTSDVYWFNDDHGSYLFIGDITASKVYDCFATNTNGETSKQFHVSVVNDVPPYFDGNIEYRNIIERQSVEFFCRAQSQETVSYDWLDEEFNPIEETNNTSIENTYDASSLYIGNVGENVSAYYTVYEGDYHCNATNIYGTSIKTFRLSVLMVFPRFPYMEESVEYREGVFDRLPCFVLNDEKVSLTWLNGEFNQITETEELHRYVSKDGSYLYFYNLRPVDGGDYYCNATNIYGSRTKVFHLSVLTNKKPFFGENKIHVNAFEGSSVQFYCSARSDEKVNYYWYVEDFSEDQFFRNITNTSDVYIVNANNASILILDNVKVMKNEEYRCAGRNIYGGKSKTFTVSVEADFDPVNVNDRKNVTVLKGSKLELLCWDPRTEEATYQWTNEDGEPLTESSEFPVYVSSTDKGSVLTINKMESNYSGIYFCNVSTSNGYNLTEYDIQISTIYGIDPWISI